MKTNDEHLYPEKTILKLTIQIKKLFQLSITLACLFLIFFILYFVQFVKNENIQIVKNNNIPVADSVTKELFYQYNKQLCVINLMLHESYKENSYKCPAGYKTIGFGHQIKPCDKIPDKIDFKTAYIILESDYNGAIAYARELGYVDDDTKQLAVAHAIFCLGVGTIKNIADFKNDIIKYVYYRNSDGGIVNSSYLLESRLFEKNMYNKTINLLTL
jgi:hypothetical protein